MLSPYRPGMAVLEGNTKPSRAYEGPYLILDPYY